MTDMSIHPCYRRVGSLELSRKTVLSRALPTVGLRFPLVRDRSFMVAEPLVGQERALRRFSASGVAATTSLNETFYKMPDDLVPSWNGDPASFEQFATSCKWYEMGLKDSERKLAASRVWQKLSGAAKSVVRHLDPADYDSTTGLMRLLSVLRDSPLQKLPVPDSFSRLEKWSGLRRAQGESIPQLLVREEELFVELQQALKRARLERTKLATTSTSTSAPERDPASSPTRSPQGFAARDKSEADGEVKEERMEHEDATTGFFEDELRGYRLLKAAKLNHTERQHILTLTKNSTHFVAVRRALRTHFL